MPIYAEAKRRQMARSILPSIAANGSRHTRALIHRSYRRSVNQHLAGLSRCTDPAEVDLGDLTRYPQHRIREMVRDRRAADKLNHFERWAVRSTMDIPVQNRLSHLRSVLPDGLIGDHAVSHLRWIDKIVPPAEHDWRYRRSGRYPQRPDPVPVLAARLRTLVETGGHAQLNRMIRKTSPYVWDESTQSVVFPRTLAGVHDVEELALAVIRRAGGRAHAEAVYRVLAAWSL